MHLVDAPKWDESLVGEDAFSVMKLISEDQISRYHGRTVTMKNSCALETNVELSGRTLADGHVQFGSTKPK